MIKKKSRLIEILATFNKKEWAKFNSFVGFRISNSDEDELTLLKLLNQFYPDFDEYDLDRPNLLKLLGKKKLTDQRLRWAMTTLHSLAADFLKISEARGRAGDFLLLNQFTQRGLARHHQSLSKKMSVAADGVPRNLNWYFLDHRLSFEIDQFEERQMARRQITGLQEVSDKLDTYFLLAKLKQACAMMSYQRVSNQKYDIKLLEPVLMHLEEHPPTEPLLNMYHCCTMMMHGEKRAYYEKLIVMLSIYRENIDQDEIRDLHVLARNHCIRAINLGDRSYERELFKLYQLGLEHEVVQSVPAQFAPSFKNIVSVSLKLKEFDWAEEFIQEYAPLLGRKFQSDYLRYNLAILNFARARYDECRRFIHAERFTDLYIRLNVRILRTKTYYELGQVDELDSQLESFKQFLHRNKQLSYHRKNCANFIKYVRILFNLKPGDARGSAKLKRRIKSAANLSERNWLVKKVEEKA